MRTLLAFLLAATWAFCQNPAANIGINTTNVQGGIIGDCLTVNSSKKLGQQACGAGGVSLGGDVTGPSGANTVVKLQNRAVSSASPSTGQGLAWNGSAWAPVSGGSQLAPGSNTQVIFNDVTFFGADAGLTYNKTTDSLTAVGSIAWGASASLVPAATGADILFPAGAAYFYLKGTGSTGNYFGLESNGAGLNGLIDVVMSSQVNTGAGNSYADVIFFQVNNPNAGVVYKSPFDIRVNGAYQDNGTLTGTFALENGITSTTFFSYISGGAMALTASGGAMTLNTVNNFGLMVPFGNSGFFEAKNATGAACTGGGYCYNVLNNRATVDSMSKYFDSSLTYYGYNASAMTPIYGGMSVGVEGTYADNNSCTSCRWYMVDKVSGDNVAVYDFGTKVLTFYPQTSVDDNFTVTGTAQFGHVDSLTNCADSAGAAACGAAPAGAVVIDAGATTVVVSTTAVAANSQIFVTFDSSLSTRLGITCNATVALPVVSARTTSTSFTISVPAAPAVNPACFDYFIIN